MCGFSALVNFRDAQPRHRACANALQKMTDLVAHRGPDGEGFATICQAGGVTTRRAGAGPCRTERNSQAEYFIGMGHRRLAIVDLSEHGHQPMADPEGRFWIVYNGEIYNHVELADELKNLGVTLAGHCDTEVLLHAYRLWGPDCLQRLNGMFAFVIVDRERRQIFAARDRFGIKPLYYWINPDGFLAFASEIKQFTALPGWSAKINPQRAYDFLAWGATDHTDETMFAGVMQLKPGHAVNLLFDVFASGQSLRSQRLPVYPWYELRVSQFDGDFSQAAERFRELFDASVQRRLRSDVPVGACLSGGLDSSSIVAVIDHKLKAEAGEPVATFSACSEIERINERKWVDIVTQSTSSRPHYVTPTVGELLGDLPQIIWHQDEPFATTNIFAQWLVFQSVGRSNVKVMLDGQGADEQLAGYDIFFGIKLANLLAQGKLSGMMGEFKAIQAERGYSASVLLMLLANNSLPGALIDPLRKFVNRTSLKPDWIDLQRLSADPVYPFAPNSSRGTSIQKVNSNQISRTSLQKLLRFEDRNSMAFSVEARVPFLDHHLVEFILGLPDEYKLDAGVTKRVLREAMTGILPEPIRTRTDKLGFQTAEEVWLRGERRDQFRQMVKDAIARSDGILNPAASRRCEAVFSSSAPFSSLPWKIISFGGWMNAYNVST